MKTQTSFRWLGLGLILTGLLALTPAPSHSQCMVINTVVIPGTAGSPYNKVYKTLNGPYVCQAVTSTNISLCAPMVPILRTRITASAGSMVASPTCQISCTGGCGTITIDSSDGLPVELMDFTIED